MEEKQDKKQINIILESLLKDYKKGSISEKDFISEIKNIYFEDIGFAKVDHHRSLRRNFPEVIFGQNKTYNQILEISKKILNYSDILLITRTGQDIYGQLKKEIPGILFN